MKIISRDRSASLSIVVRELGLDRSIRCSIALVSNGFSASNRLAWLSREAVESFSTKIRILEVTRSGEASLCAMSPDDFSMSFAAIDLSGHICCCISISRRIPDFGRWLTQRMSAEFMIDPSILPSICRVVESELLTSTISKNSKKNAGIIAG